MVHFWKRLIYLLFKPGEFFMKLDKEDIRPAVEMVVELFLFMLAALVIVLLYLSLNPGNSSSILTIIIWGLMFMVGAGILLVLFTDLLHVITIVFEAEEKYRATLNVVLYAVTGTTVLSMIPLLQFVGWIYGGVLLYYGLKNVHGIGHTRSIIAATIFTVISAFIIILLGTFLVLRV